MKAKIINAEVKVADSSFVHKLEVLVAFDAPVTAMEAQNIVNMAICDYIVNREGKEDEENN